MEKTPLAEQQTPPTVATYSAEIDLLKDQNSTLKKDNQSLLVRNQNLEVRNQALEDELALEKARSEHFKNLFLNSRQKQYGKSSEASEQLNLNLFDEAELENLIDVIDNTEGEVTEQKVRSFTRRVGRSRILKVDPNTPIVDINHDGEAPECECGSNMEQVGEFTRDTLAVIPATKVIVRHHYPQFRCSNCLGEENEEQLVTVSDDSLLSGTICDSSLLATVVVDKMQYSLPLYRQEQRFASMGIDLSRQVMSGWMMNVAHQLKPLGRALERAIHEYPLWNVDETGLRVLKVPDAKASDSSYDAYMFVRSSVDREGRAGPVLFNYIDRRTNESVASFFEDYRGVVQSDGLEVYSYASQKYPFTSLGCMIHARRKATDILKTNKKAKLAGELVSLYATFFHHEGLLLDRQRGPNPLSEEEYLKKRREILSVDLDAIKRWLDEHQGKVLKGSSLDSAINYTLKRWEKLTRFLDYSWATSTNQLVENCIRPFALGRKNFLFCITPQGAEASALYFSLIESCKKLDMDSHKYLTYVFNKGGGCKSDADWDALVPGRVDISEVDHYYDLISSAKADPERKEPYILRGKRH